MVTRKKIKYNQIEFEDNIIRSCNLFHNLRYIESRQRSTDYTSAYVYQFELMNMKEWQIVNFQIYSQFNIYSMMEFNGDMVERALVAALILIFEEINNWVKEYDFELIGKYDLRVDSVINYLNYQEKKIKFPLPEMLSEDASPLECIRIYNKKKVK